MIDNTIGGRYTLQSILGSGAMGTVYLGIDSVSQIQVAVKALKTDIATPELIERFRREGEALRDLNHPNIVKMLDAIEEDGNHFLVMEYINGGDLKTLIEQEGKLDYSRCVDMAIDLADALTRAHRLNIIHRDLKPANVLIGDDGVLRLTDFGIAHVGDKQRVTDTDVIVGTVDYLSPEALNGNPIDSRADIWAFGVMLFEMLTGTRPFQGTTLSATITAILTGSLPEFDSLAVEVPIALQDLIYRMLERELVARISSVRYVGAELEDILQGRNPEPIVSRFQTSTSDTINPTFHNLPAQPTPFVGREHELDQLDNLLRDPNIRLITILAPGGMGKTRLSLAMAERQIGNFADGVYFIELAPLNDPEHIIVAIATAINYQFQSDEREPEQKLLDFLSSKAILLVFDNFEHLIEKAGLVTNILKVAPAIKIVVTSRQRLNQSGETLFHLVGMRFPDWETPEDAMEYAAVHLYQSSAKRAQPNFELRSDNLQYVARICRLVDGMPLGIVLAAAWEAMLSTQEIASEIASTISFLENTGGDLPDRQHSIQAVFDYSWQILTEDEQLVFMKLSYFRGGFSREAAQDIAGANLRQLISLVNKSLLRRDVNTGRYEIHVLLRQYVEQKSEQHADIMQNTHEAHANFFLQLAQKLESDLLSADQIVVCDRLQTDHENYRIAISWLSSQKRYEVVLQISNALLFFWYFRGHVNEGYRWISMALDQVTDSNTTRAKGLYSASFLIWVKGDLSQAQAYIEESLTISRQLDDQIAISSALVFKGWLLWWAGEPQTARTVLETGTDLCRRLNNDWSLSFGLYWLAHTYFEDQDISIQQQDLTQPRLLMEECAVVSNRLGERTVRAFSAECLGHVAIKSGYYTEARTRYMEALKLREELSDKWGMAWTFRNLSTVSGQEGNLAEQKEFILRALALFSDLGVGWVIDDTRNSLEHVETLIANQ